MSSFDVTEAELRPGCWVIRVEGELDLAVADQMSAALDRASEYPVVLIDLTSCEFVDSTGLAVFVRAYNGMKRDGRRFAVFGASDQILRIFSVTGLTKNSLLFESAEEALEAEQSPET